MLASSPLSRRIHSFIVNTLVSLLDVSGKYHNDFARTLDKQLLYLMMSTRLANFTNLLDSYPWVDPPVLRLVETEFFFRKFLFSLPDLVFVYMYTVVLSIADVIGSERDTMSESFNEERRPELYENLKKESVFRKLMVFESVEHCIIERASHEQELKMTLKKLRDETSSGIVSDEKTDKQELEAHYGFMAKIQEVLLAESSSTDTPLEQVQNNDEKNVFANERQHFKKHAAESADERAALANLIANLTLDTEENKTILKQ
ncbi:hypothetical protein Tco_1375361, partial [Tanacetum coccineum]